ncbi:MAG: cytidine deaminase [Elusimicrobia bacterium]|nr:cytidine deaminase [Elusimicrobiota bacterium]
MTDKLIKTAIEYREKAYAPYSSFKVGAAVECESGNIYGGCNIENSSYGVTICAERVAITKAVSEGERVIKRLAVVTADKDVSVPCGACRQFLIEFARDAQILCCDTGGSCDMYRAEDLIPHFDKRNVFRKNLNELRKRKGL